MADFERSASPINWLLPTDHDIAGYAVKEMTFDNDDPHISLASLKSEHFTQDPDTYADLLTVGRHLIPYDQIGNEADTGRHDAYALGTDLALATLDILCERHGIQIESFRKVWRLNGLVKIVDLSAEKIKDLSPVEKYDVVAQGILAVGHRAMEGFGSAYEELLDAASTISSAAATHPGIVRASYGYVLGGGILSLNRILEEFEVQRSITDLDSLDANVLLWSTQEATKQPAVIGMVESIDHENFANAIDTRAFYAEDSAETYLGKMVECEINADEETVEILNALALLMYPNDLQNFALDEDGEAFFYGAVLAHQLVQWHGDQLCIDNRTYASAWKAQPVHRWLKELDELPETKLERLEQQFANVLSAENVTAIYDPLIEKISSSLDYEETELSAFHNGFHYVLSTGTEALRSCRKAAISKLVTSESKNLDDELKNLLGG